MTRRTISFSELDTANQCALKHQLAYVERWTKKQDPMSALGKGTAWHNVMEAHYNVLMGLQKQPNLPEYQRMTAAREAVEDQLRRMPDDLADLIEWMYDGYVNFYGADREWHILAVEHAAECRLPALSGNPSSFVLKVKIDLVVRNRLTRRISLVDHKSGKDLPGEKTFELDDQFGLYTWALRQLGHKPFNSIHNAARTFRLQEDIKEPGATPLDKRYKRTPMYRSDTELNTIAIEAYLRASARYRQQSEITRAAKAAGPKSQIVSPRSTDPERCTWRCDFKEACLAGRKGIPIRGFLKDQGLTQQFERH